MMQSSQEQSARLKMIALLLAGFPSRADDAADIRAMAYYRAVEAFPSAALKSAVDRFIKGDVPTHEGRYAPSCAEFARECRLQVIAMDQRHKNELKALSPPEPTRDLPEHERREVLKRLGELVNPLASRRTSEIKTKHEDLVNG